MEVYNLIFGEGSIQELNTIPLGANYRRLGYSKEQMFRAYSREAYPAEHFDRLEYGFDNDGKLNIPTRRMSQHNLPFLAGLLIQRKEIQGYQVAGTLIQQVRPEHDTGVSPCCFDELVLALKHPQYALVCLCSFRITYPPDGYEYAWWSYEIFADTHTTNIYSRGKSTRQAAKSLKHAMWTRFQNRAFEIRICGANSRSATTLHQSTTLHARGERPQPYVEEVAQGLSVFVNHIVLTEPVRSGKIAKPSYSSTLHDYGWDGFNQDLLFL